MNFFLALCCMQSLKEDYVNLEMALKIVPIDSLLISYVKSS